jgi:hypothetical protein
VCPPVAFKKLVHVIKKIRGNPGKCRLISLVKVRGRYIWDKRPGYYSVEWWDGRERKRQLAGITATEAIDGQRGKSHELIGELFAGSERAIPEEARETSVTRIDDATRMFLDHVKVHSPDRPKTHQRYEKVLEHFERVLGKRKYIETLSPVRISTITEPPGASRPAANNIKAGSSLRAGPF